MSGPCDLGAVRAWTRAQPTPVRIALACAEHPDPRSPRPAESAESADPVVGERAVETHVVDQHPLDAQTEAKRVVDEESVLVRVPGCLVTAPRADVVGLLADGAHDVVLLLDGCEQREATAARFADLVALLTLPGGAGSHARPRLSAVVDPVAGGAALHPMPRPGVLNGASMPLPRRTMLGAHDLHTSAPASAVSSPAVGTAPPAVAPGSDHAELLTALAVLTERDAVSPGVRVGPDPDVAVTTAGPGVLLRATRCTACAVCVRACPEGALTMRVDTGASVLEQRVDACSGCGTCLESCPAQALSVRRRARWSEHLRQQVLPLTVVETHACARCGAQTPDHGDDLCEVCSYRRAHPFGSVLPAAAL